MWSKIWVREKTKHESGRNKCSKSDLFLWIMTPIQFGPLKFWHILKVDTQGIQNLLKIFRAQRKINSELRFEILCSKTWVREKQNVSQGENWFVLNIILKTIHNSFKPCCSYALLILMIITKYGEEVLLNDAFRFCSDVAFNIQIWKSCHFFLPDSCKGFYIKSKCFKNKSKNLLIDS